MTPLADLTNEELDALVVGGVGCLKYRYDCRCVRCLIADEIADMMEAACLAALRAKGVGDE